jgi:hypothetical protein
MPSWCSAQLKQKHRDNFTSTFYPTCNIVHGVWLQCVGDLLAVERDDVINGDVMVFSLHGIDLYPNFDPRLHCDRSFESSFEDIPSI